MPQQNVAQNLDKMSVPENISSPPLDWQQWDLSFSIGYSVIFTLGLGNVFIATLILCNRQLRKPNNLLILQLCLAGTILNISLVFSRGYPLTGYAPLEDTSCQILLIMKQSADRAILLFTAWISVDRYSAVCKASASHTPCRLDSYAKAATATAIVWTIVFGSMLPLIATGRSSLHSEQSINGLCTLTAATFHVEACLIFFLGSTAVISYCYAMIALFVYASLRRLRSHASTPRRVHRNASFHKRTAVVVLILWTFHISCWLPRCIAHLLNSFGVPVGQFGQLAELLCYTNSALNPLIYTLSAKLFRQVVAETVRGIVSRIERSTEVVVQGARSLHERSSSSSARSTRGISSPSPGSGTGTASLLQIHPDRSVAGRTLRPIQETQL